MKMNTSQSTAKTNNIYFLFALILILADQATKLAVKGFDLLGFHHDGMYYGQSIKVIGDTLQWTYIENPGMAFGIEFGWGKIFLSLFSILAGIALGVYLYKIIRAHPGVKIGIMLIFAGAVGNLIDRVFYGVFYGTNPLFYGHVVDFIQVDIPDVQFFGYYYSSFPVFNIADSCVTCGVVALLIFHSKLPQIKETFCNKPSCEANEPNELSPQSDEQLNKEL